MRAAGDNREEAFHESFELFLGAVVRSGRGGTSPVGGPACRSLQGTGFLRSHRPFCSGSAQRPSASEIASVRRSEGRGSESRSDAPDRAEVHRRLARESTTWRCGTRSSTTNRSSCGQVKDARQSGITVYNIQLDARTSFIGGCREASRSSSSSRAGGTARRRSVRRRCRQTPGPRRLATHSSPPRLRLLQQPCGVRQDHRRQDSDRKPHRLQRRRGQGLTILKAVDDSNCRANHGLGQLVGVEYRTACR